MIRKAMLAALAALTVAAPAAAMAQPYFRGPPPAYGWRPPPPVFDYGYRYGGYRPQPVFYGPACWREVHRDFWGYRHVVTRCR